MVPQTFSIPPYLGQIAAAHCICTGFIVMTSNWASCTRQSDQQRSSMYAGCALDSSSSTGCMHVCMRPNAMDVLNICFLQQFVLKRARSMEQDPTTTAATLWCDGALRAGNCRVAPTGASNWQAQSGRLLTVCLCNTTTASFPTPPCSSCTVTLERPATSSRAASVHLHQLRCSRHTASLPSYLTSKQIRMPSFDLRTHQRCLRPSWTFTALVGHPPAT